MCPQMCPHPGHGVGYMKLSDTKLRTLTEPGRYFDGRGLYLEVTPAGGRYWRMKYRHGGKEKRLAFGVYPEVSLKQARELCEASRKVKERGEDPGEVKKAAKSQAVQEARTTFEAVARDWLEHMAGKWTTETRERITAAFEADVFAKIGARPMAQMKPREVSEVVKSIEARGASDTAGRIFQRIRAVFAHAAVHELIPSNPMLDLKASALLKPRQVRHRAALEDKELPAYLSKLDAYEGDPTTRQALRLLILTAVRPGELRGARWAEVDTEAAEWRIPAERMKMRAAHVVPLSTQALEVLAQMRALSGTDELVFPSPYYPGKPLSENTLNSALARMGYKGIATAHGMRALFSTVANECGHDPDVIERQLAHKERNEVRAAYHRATYMEARATLLQWWADYLDGRRGGKVVKLGRKAGA